jgi:hypothetical protein
VHRRGATHERTARFKKIVAWRTVLNGKGRAAGFQSGEAFVYRRQMLVTVESVSSVDHDTAIVTYSWRWAPTEHGEQLLIRASDPIRAVATFTRSRRGWRVRR